MDNVCADTCAIMVGAGTVQEQEQQTLTCSKLPIKTLEKDVEHVESYQQRYQNDVNDLLLVSLLLILKVFHTPLSSASFVHFTQELICW